MHLESSPWAAPEPKKPHRPITTSRPWSEKETLRLCAEIATPDLVIWRHSTSDHVRTRRRYHHGFKQLRTRYRHSEALLGKSQAQTCTLPCTCTPCTVALRRRRSFGGRARPTRHPGFSLEGCPRESREEKQAKRDFSGADAVSPKSPKSLIVPLLVQARTFYSYNGSRLLLTHVFVCRRLNLMPWEMGKATRTNPRANPLLCGGRCTLGARSAPASTEYAGG